MKKFKAIGLMSGTSMDGIDLALIESDGVNYIQKIASDYLPYSCELRNKILDLITNKQTLKNIKIIENEITNHHLSLVKEFLIKNQLSSQDIDIIGFHGHTICHDPKNGFSWQIGNPQLLAYKTNIDVVFDFRNQDILLKGQGAPLVPIYHFHLFKKYQQFKNKNIGVLNIGGIANISIFNTNHENSLIGYDVCFGNAPFDDLMKFNFNKPYDENGLTTLQGKVNIDIAELILKNQIFHHKIPRSFDRQNFTEILKPLESLSVIDRLASMSYILAQSLKISLEILDIKLSNIFVCGGGRKNLGILKSLQQQIDDVEIADIDQIKINGDDIEAEAFAFLAIRSILKLPISFAGTTGLKEAISSSGGVLYRKN